MKLERIVQEGRRQILHAINARMICIPAQISDIRYAGSHNMSFLRLWSGQRIDSDRTETDQESRQFIIEK
jgi:hypothetical protein